MVSYIQDVSPLFDFTTGDKYISKVETPKVCIYLLGSYLNTMLFQNQRWQDVSKGEAPKCF